MTLTCEHVAVFWLSSVSELRD